MANTTFNPQQERKGTEHQDKAKQMGNEALTKGKDAGKDAMGAAKEAGAGIADKAKDVGAGIMDKAKEAVGNVGEMASNAATTVGNKAENMTSAAGHEIREFGDTIARKAPHEGVTGAVSQAVADGIRGSGRYLEEAKLSGMAHDVEQVIRNHPIPAVLICLGVGYFIGCAMRD